MKSLIFAIVVFCLGCGAFACDWDQALSDAQSEQQQARLNMQRFLGNSTEVMYAAHDAKRTSMDGMVIRLKKIKRKSKA